MHLKQAYLLSKKWGAPQISRKQKLFYRTRKAYKRALQEVLRARPKILVLHEGPCLKEIGLLGNRFIRNLLCTEQFEDLLVICGHQHWETPLASLQSGIQILNVDSRTVLLYPKSRGVTRRNATEDSRDV
jgi:hypothetical protein